MCLQGPLASGSLISGIQGRFLHCVSGKKVTCIAGAQPTHAEPENTSEGTNKGELQRGQKSTLAG